MRDPIEIARAIAQEPINKSELFSVYNRARAWAKNQPNGKAQAERVNRSLGHLQSGEALTDWAMYGTDQYSCGCPDHQYRSAQFVCKHRLAMQEAIRVIEAREAQAV